MLHCADTADIQTHGGVEFQCITASGGFRVAKHYANLHANLVNKHHQRIGVFHITGNFTQRLAHQAGLQTHVGVAHLAFNFRFRYQGGHGIHDNHVHGTGTYQHVGDFQRLLTGIRLGNDQIVHVHTQLFRVIRVQRVLRVHKGTGGAFFLGLGNHAQGQGGFTRGFRAVDFHDPPLRQPANTQGYIQPQRTGGDGRHALALAIAHAHDGTFAELALNL